MSPSAIRLTVDRRPLAIAAYRRLWVASAVCAVGGSFSVAAIPTQLFTVTGSSAAVGASAVVSFAALAVASVWTGALADVKDRRTVLLVAHCGLALTYAALWTQTVLGARSVPVLMMLVACQGLTFGAIMTTMGAVVPRIGGPQIANLLHGLAASTFGPRIVICAGGLLTTATVAVIARAVPELRHYTASS